LPYQMFGYDSAMSEVVNFAQSVDKWMKLGGREMVARSMGIS